MDARTIPYDVKLMDAVTQPKISSKFEKRDQHIDPFLLLEEEALCPICQDDLHSSPAAAFTKNGIIVCFHLVHNSCAKYITKNSKNCPMCRAQFDTADTIPSFRTNINEFMEFLDVDKRGKVTLRLLAHVLLAQLDIKNEKLSGLICKFWSKRQYRANMGVPISKAKHFCRMYLMTEEEAKAIKSSFASEISFDTDNICDCPSLAENASEWFEYWDERKCGELNEDELHRAVVRTFNVPEEDLEDVREIIAMMIYDLNNDSISYDEFIAPSGFKDNLLQNMRIS